MKTDLLRKPCKHCGNAYYTETVINGTWVYECNNCGKTLKKDMRRKPKATDKLLDLYDVIEAYKLANDIEFTHDLSYKVNFFMEDALHKMTNGGRVTHWDVSYIKEAFEEAKAK